VITNLKIIVYSFFSENSECQIKTGAAGICRESHSCKWLLDGLKKRTIKYGDIVRCGWDGDLEIICCAEPQKPIITVVMDSVIPTR
jgi:hypothetical protein